jgi:hypothetical protein
VDWYSFGNYRFEVALLDREFERITRSRSATYYPMYDLLDTLVQAQDAQNLTIDTQSELAIYLKLESIALANRLSIDLNLLVKATH